MHEWPTLEQAWAAHDNERRARLVAAIGAPWRIVGDIVLRPLTWRDCITYDIAGMPMFASQRDALTETQQRAHVLRFLWLQRVQRVRLPRIIDAWARRRFAARVAVIDWERLSADVIDYFDAQFLDAGVIGFEEPVDRSPRRVQEHVPAFVARLARHVQHDVTRYAQALDAPISMTLLLDRAALVDRGQSVSSKAAVMMTQAILAAHHAQQSDALEVSP